MARAARQGVSPAIALPVVFLAAGLTGCVSVDRMIFQPPLPTYRDGPAVVKVRTDDGAAISALHLKNPGAVRTILYSHGNAADLGVMYPFLVQMRDAGFSVFAYDYRGYGTSEGRPSEGGAYLDIEAAYRYLTEQAGTPPEQIIAHGQSLGGALAIHLAASRPVGGLIVESGFVSAFRVVLRYPPLPLDRFRNLAKMKKAKCPVLVIHGGADDIIAPWHGRRLFDAAPWPKKAWWVKGAGHNDLAAVAGEHYWEMLRRFAASLPSGVSAVPPRAAP